MSDDLRDLYQEVILDHGKRPRNARAIDDPAAIVQTAYNPLCGDRGMLYLKLTADHGTVEDVSYVGQGCSISTASASIMTDFVRGKSRDEALETFRLFHDMITSGPDTAAHRTDPKLGKLAIFSGVAEFPARVKCASLSWHALKAALSTDAAHRPQSVSTE